LSSGPHAYPASTNASGKLPIARALESYNRFHPHRALGGLTPLQRVNNLSDDN